MAPAVSDPWLESAVLMLAIASFSTWIALLRRRKQGPILPYEPRRPVPWSGIWTLLPILLVALAIGGTIVGDAPDDAKEPEASADFIERIALGSVQQIAFVAAFLTVVIAASRATRADLGLPQNLQQLVCDVRIGVIAWLASLLPVYVVQATLVSIFGQPVGHPLINMLEDQGSSALFAMAFFVAVIVAPLCEELTFRLLLQGWLEKWEDLRLGWRTVPAPQVEESSVVDSQAVETLAYVEPERPQLGVAGFHYGWIPIVASSLLFALAHFGYGPDPVPLFLLALILGYVYQRTHRILPSIVTHALFNGMSLFALWRVMSAAGP